MSLNTKSIVSASVPVPETKMIKVYRKNVFAYPSSDNDEKIFRAGITAFVRAMGQASEEDPILWALDTGIKFHSHMMNLVYEVNNQGKTAKYQHKAFEKKKIVLDNVFWEWAKLAAKQIYREVSEENIMWHTPTELEKQQMEGRLHRKEGNVNINNFL